MAEERKREKCMGRKETERERETEREKISCDEVKQGK